MGSTDEYMLTTVDNPYDPFTQFDSWFAFDEQNGYHSCGLLSRIIDSSFEISEETEEMVTDEAMNEIVRLFPGLYMKVKPKKVIVEGGT